MSRVFLLLIMVLTLVSVSFASIPQDPSQQPQPQAPSGQPGAAQPMPNTNSPATPRVVNRSYVSGDDKRFVSVASESSKAEVAHAELALQRAASDDVKQFAQRLIDDQKKANQDLIQLATNKGVKVLPSQTAPAPLTGKYRDMNDRLAALSGEEFDREYMRNQVRMRQECIAIFERQVKKGKDTELRSFAIQALPALRERQRATQDLADKIGAMKKPVNKAPDNTSQPSNTSAPSTPPNK